jgi:hypothetical protein
MGGLTYDDLMAVTRLRRRWPRSAIASVSLLAVAGALTSCGESSDSNTATWELDPEEQVTSVTTTLAAVVSRTGCSSGVQGEPEAPEINYTESEIRITFRIRPRTDSGTCEGLPGVPYKIKLGEPLGDRSLVDGECHPGSTAWATAFCLKKGVRYSPR